MSSIFSSILLTGNNNKDRKFLDKDCVLPSSYDADIMVIAICVCVTIRVFIIYKGKES